MSGFVCFCSELRLYHYYREDGSRTPDGKVDPNGVLDYKFTDDELEAVIAAKLSEGNEKDARELAYISGLARINPHKVVKFDDKNNISVEDPVFQSDLAGEE